MPSEKQISGEYEPPTGTEAEIEPGSDGRVLRNKLGIRSIFEIDNREYEALLTTQVRYLEVITSKTRFTTKRLRDIHREWLGEIYEWAGEYRTVEMSKDGFQWPPAFRVADNMANFEAGYPMPQYPFEGRNGMEERRLYIEAVKKGYLGEYDFLARFFREAIERRKSSSV